MTNITTSAKEPGTASRSAHKRARTIAITSGKGGVGKTFVSANLAAALARTGRTVLLLDADLGLANLDIVFNVHPTVTLHDVMSGSAEMDAAVIEVQPGVFVLPAASGLLEYSSLTGEVQTELTTVIADLVGRYDYLLLDTGAGISDLVLFTASLAEEVLLVATPEPTSITDVYATIKVLATMHDRTKFNIVFNQVRNEKEGARNAAQLQGVVDRYLKSQSGTAIKLHHRGDIPLDPSVSDALRKRKLLIQAFPGAPAAKSIVALAAAIDRTP